VLDEKASAVEVVDGGDAFERAQAGARDRGVDLVDRFVAAPSDERRVVGLSAALLNHGDKRGGGGGGDEQLWSRFASNDNNRRRHWREKPQN
jgi:hypothetical protein